MPSNVHTSLPVVARSKGALSSSISCGLYTYTHTHTHHMSNHASPGPIVHNHLLGSSANVRGIRFVQREQVGLLNTVHH